MNDHELGFLAFLAEPSRRRMRTLLELGPKRRKDVRGMLDHSVGFDPRLRREFSGAGALSGAIEARLRALGAPDACFVISADPTLDDREMTLHAALQALSSGNFGGFVSCLPGKLGYFVYEAPDGAYLLQR